VVTKIINGATGFQSFQGSATDITAYLFTVIRVTLGAMKKLIFTLHDGMALRAMGTGKRHNFISLNCDQSGYL
jgi:hypothetical protein